ncbi:Nn.00g023520.m01.CDS01 [Neocucurbitaria sp. VM-36]
MSSVPSSPNPSDTVGRRRVISPGASNVNVHFTNNGENNVLRSKPPATLNRNSTSPEDGPLTPQLDVRRQECSWYFQPLPNNQRINNRNPLPPERSDLETPPALQEIIRSSTVNDTDSIHHIRLQPINTAESQHPARSLSRSSTIGSTLSHSDARRSSIAAYAKGLVRRIPDLRMFPPTPGKAARSPEGHTRRDSQDAVSIKYGREYSKPSVILPSELKSRNPHTNTPKAAPTVKITSSQPITSSSLVLQTHGKGSLKDRRKVKLDLSLPTGLSDLPVRSRPSAGASSSITPSRPRSPKTPWSNNETPKWELSKLPKSAPIMEEDYIQNTPMGDMGLLPANSHIMSESPVSERQFSKIRDHLYDSRSRVKNQRSDLSVTSEPPLTQTPDDTWTSNDPTLQHEKDAHTTEELKRLGQTSKLSRLRRWRWRASSDEALQSPESPKRRSSISPFKRSTRIVEQTDYNDSREVSTPFPGPGRDRPTQLTSPVPNSPLAHMALPPQFVPPGVNRVPTPPVFDADSMIKGKLANFFFDVQGSSARAPRRNPRGDPSGHWDSDALLMSLSSIMDADEDEEEGPEGRPPSYIPSTLLFDTNGTPEITSGPSGLKGSSPGLTVPSPALKQDKWFHIQHSDSPDEHASTALALKEEDERRKFEWLIPEHLPNSPLCPLSPIYRGPCKGVCYWHEEKKMGHRKSRIIKEETSVAWARQRSGNYFGEKGKQRLRRGSRSGDVGILDVQVKKAKKRRLDSLSSP